MWSMGKKPDKNTARARVVALFRQAELMHPYDQTRADRYVKKAWNLATHSRIAMPLALKRSFCRKCKSYWKQGRSVRIRLRPGKKVYTCLVCGAIKRVPVR